MRKLLLAAAAMLAATLLAENASAVTVSPANGLHAKSSTVLVHYRHKRSHRRRACRCGGCRCAPCGCYLYTYSTRCMNCGTCGGCWDYYRGYYGPRAECGCGCGYYGFYSGWRPFGWLF